MSKGLNTLGGYVGGAAAIAGVIFFMVSLGSDSDEPIMSIVMYGGLTIAILGFLLIHYAERHYDDD